MSARWINLGCGGNRLPSPWENFDSEVDISKPLPFPDRCAEFMFAEHVVEHITTAEAWGFFNEAFRVLGAGGILRIAVPSIETTWEKATPAYLNWLKAQGFGDGTRKGAVANLILNHGHRALWSVGLLQTALEAAGFGLVAGVNLGISRHAPLLAIEGHGKVIGDQNNRIETIVVEASKIR